MLRRIGVTGDITGQAPSTNATTGATLSGPNPIITSPFRHLFSQEQIDQFGQHTPMEVNTLASDGTMKQQTLNWWDPNAQLTEAITVLNKGKKK